MAKRGSDEWKAKISATLKGRRLSPKSEFKKGNVPWTAGLKGIHLSPATEFKKGCPRGQAARNWRSVGMLSIRTHRGHRQRFIKVCEGGPPRKRWMPLARYWWERSYGPVPRGCCIVHRDGNTLNDNLANLMLVERKNLLEWQKSVRPQMEIRRKAGVRESQKLRWRIFRMKRATEEALPELRMGDGTRG